MQRDPAKFWNPYVAGAALGLVLLSSYVVMGKGIGASGASYRLGVAAVQTVAPEHVATAPGLKGAVQHGSPLDDWLVFEVLGVALGGLVGAYTSGLLVMMFMDASTRGFVGLFQRLAFGVLHLWLAAFALSLRPWAKAASDEPAGAAA